MNGNPNGPDQVEQEWIFYDGDCGVCHGTVGFVARRDRRKRPFHFAPLGGETFRRKVPAERAATLPDTVVVWSPDGRLLLRSQGLLHILRRLGGGWWLLSWLVWIVPRPLRDRFYDGFARIRHRLVGKPQGSCPVMPAELARRFAP